MTNIIFAGSVGGGGSGDVIGPATNVDSSIPLWDGINSLTLKDSGYTISAFGSTLIDDTTAGAALTTLGVSSFAQTILDDTDAATALTTLGVSSFAQTVLDDTDAATARATLGVVIGTNVQAWDTDLDTWATKTPPSGVVLGTTDTQTLTNKTLTGTQETAYAITDGAGFAIDPTNGGIQTVTLAANRTPTVANFSAGHSVLIGITSATFTVTWTTIGVTWIGGTAPTLGTRTWVELWKVGTTVFGAYVGDA